jgi:hypothetical protein
LTPAARGAKVEVELVLVLNRPIHVLNDVARMISEIVRRIFPTPQPVPIPVRPGTRRRIRRR